MNESLYLCIRKYGHSYNPKYLFRVTKTSPSLDKNEIALRIEVNVPDAVFEKPQLEATINVPEEAVNAPVISAEVVDNVEEIIKQNTGFEVKLNLVKPEEEEN